MAKGRCQHVHDVLADKFGIGSVRVRHLARLVEGGRDLVGGDELQELGKDLALILETGFVCCVGEDIEDVLKSAEVKKVEKRVLDFWWHVLEVIDELLAGGESDLGDVPHGVLESPYNAIHDQFELSRGHSPEGCQGKLEVSESTTDEPLLSASLRQRTIETILVDRPNQAEKPYAMLWVLLKVFADHTKRALENSIENTGHTVRNETLECRNDGRHHIENFGITRRFRVGLVIQQHGFQERLNHVVQDSPQVIRARHVVFNKLEHLFLDRSQLPNSRGTGGYRSLFGALLRHQCADGLVQSKHVDINPAKLDNKRSADRRAGRDVRFQYVPQNLEVVRAIEDVDVASRLRDQVVPCHVGKLHQLHDQPLLLDLVRLRRNHIAHGLVERVHLLRSEIRGDLVDGREYLLDIGLDLASLLHDKVTFALLRDFNESIARHVLNTLVGFVHELEKFVDHGFQEFPVRFQESRVLSDDVHDVTCNDGFVVLAAFHFAQSEQLLDDSDEESLLNILGHGTTDGSDGPTQPGKGNEG